MIFFLGLETSSLCHDSHPIEIGWCDTAGQGESHLIRPEPTWNDWSLDAERLHGLTPRRLRLEGEPAEVVAGRVIAFLERTGCNGFYSDVPPFDCRCLNKLLRTCGFDLWQVPVRSVTDAYAQACDPLRHGLPSSEFPDHAATEREVRILTARLVDEAEQAERRRKRIRHRAFPNAHGLAWCWQEMHRRAREISGS